MMDQENPAPADQRLEWTTPEVRAFAPLAETAGGSFPKRATENSYYQPS